MIRNTSLVIPCTNILFGIRIGFKCNNLNRLISRHLNANLHIITSYACVYALQVYMCMCICT